MALDRATVSRIRSAQERYDCEKAKGVITKMELGVMASRLGDLYTRLPGGKLDEAALRAVL